MNFRDGGSGETGHDHLRQHEQDPVTTPATGWDGSVTHEGIEIDPSPRTIICTIVIDP